MQRERVARRTGEKRLQKRKKKEDRNISREQEITPAGILLKKKKKRL